MNGCRDGELNENKRLFENVQRRAGVACRRHRTHPWLQPVSSHLLALDPREEPSQNRDAESPRIKGP